MNRVTLLLVFVLAVPNVSVGQVFVRENKKDAFPVDRYQRFLKPANQFGNDYSIPFQHLYNGNLNFHFAPSESPVSPIQYRNPTLGEAKFIGGIRRGVSFADYSRKYDFIFEVKN